MLVAAGWSAVLLGLFYWIVDVFGWLRGFAPFLWVGANPIALYFVIRPGILPHDF
ncbi:MAG: hypothetical protein Q8M07_04740 [Prosthecobacter sp.]|nr:hypothetical protein [Prosthecobacter sp.]